MNTASQQDCGTGSFSRRSRRERADYYTGSQVAPRCLPVIALSLLLCGFIALVAVLPLRTAIRIGADEDFELSRAALVLKGYKLYTEVWDDQPPLYTRLLTTAAKWSPPHSSTSPSLYQSSSPVLGPRLVTVCFSLLLISSFFVLIYRFHCSPSFSLTTIRSDGAAAIAAIATLLLIVSPGFIELGCSCMQEIPALAPVLASFCMLTSWPQSKTSGSKIAVAPVLSLIRLLPPVVLAGLLFALALQLKLIAVVHSPIILLLLWIQVQSRPPGLSEPPARAPEWSSAFVRFAVSCAVFAATTILAFVLLNWLTGSPLRIQLQQAWAAHFAPARSSEYGSALQHGYDWTVLFKNWEATVPALLALLFLVPCIKNAFTDVRRSPSATLNPATFNPLLVTLAPLLWLVLTFAVFGLHKPWWAYYYIHNALPLCWCAGIGFFCFFNFAVCRFRTSHLGARTALGRQLLVPLGYCIFALLSAVWFGARLYGEVTDMRTLPRTYSSYLLKKIERYKPYTTFMFTDQPVYSFHAGLPVPPHLAMLSLKRMWTGEMTNARLVSELESVKPGLILWSNDSRELPFQELLNREYQVVYLDSANRLFVHKTIARKGFM